MHPHCPPWYDVDTVFIIDSMDQRTGILVLMVGVGALVLGFVFGKNDVSVVQDEAVSTPKHVLHQSGVEHADMTMREMIDGLQGKTGDAFDKAFVEMMIAHHEGAVDMAKLIPAQAKHAELKQLGQDIIIAQSQEIMLMKRWLVDWGYASDGTDSQMGH